MKKRGYLLVECALYIWFCAIFSSMILTIFMPYIKEFKNEIKASTSYNYMLSASMYIESAVFDDNVYKILVKDNELNLYKNDKNLEIDIIKLKEINRNNKLVVEHRRLKDEENSLDLNDETSNIYNNISKFDDKNYIWVATNTILKDVENFNVVQNGDIITIYLKQYAGEERVFCYETKYYEDEHSK